MDSNPNQDGVFYFVTLGTLTHVHTGTSTDTDTLFKKSVENFQLIRFRNSEIRLSKSNIYIMQTDDTMNRIDMYLDEMKKGCNLYSCFLALINKAMFLRFNLVAKSENRETLCYLLFRRGKKRGICCELHGAVHLPVSIRNVNYNFLFEIFVWMMILKNYFDWKSW